MLKIRLRRTGKRHQPSYRVVVVEHTAPIQGSYLESLGTYNPRATQFIVNADRVLHWLNNGAQPSERVAKLLKNAGVEHRLIVLPDYTRKPQRAPKKALPTAPAAVAPTETNAETTEATALPVAPTETTDDDAPNDAVEPATEPTTAPAPVEDGSNSQPAEASAVPAESGTPEENQ